jgi:hypothetical protein
VPIVSLTLKQQNLMSRAVLQPLELHMLSACAAEKCDKADDEKKKKVSFLSVALSDNADKYFSRVRKLRQLCTVALCARTHDGRRSYWLR